MTPPSILHEDVPEMYVIPAGASAMARAFFTGCVPVLRTVIAYCTFTPGFTMAGLFFTTVTVSGPAPASAEKRP